MQRFGRQARVLNQRIGGITAFAGRAAGALASLGAGGFGIGGAVREFARAEAGLDKIVALTSATRKEVDALRPGLRAIGGELGFTETQLAESAFGVLSAGIEDVEGQLDTVRTAALGARLGMGSLAQQTLLLTRAMNVFQREGATASQIQDRLTAAAEAGVGEVSEYGRVLERVSGTVLALGANSVDTLALIATFSTAVGPQFAATQIDALFRGLFRQAEQSKAALTEIGIQVGELPRIVRERGVLAVLERLDGALSKLGTVERELAIGRIFPDAEAIKGFTTAINNLERYERTIRTVEDSQGRTFEAAEETLGGVAVQAERVGKSFKQWAADTGESLANITNLEGLLKKIADEPRPITEATTQGPFGILTGVDAGLRRAASFGGLRGAGEARRQRTPEQQTKRLEELGQKIGELIIDNAVFAAVGGVVAGVAGRAVSLAPVLYRVTRPEVQSFNRALNSVSRDRAGNILNPLVRDARLRRLDSQLEVLTNAPARAVARVAGAGARGTAGGVAGDVESLIPTELIERLNRFGEEVSKLDALEDPESLFNPRHLRQWAKNIGEAMDEVRDVLDEPAPTPQVIQDLIDLDVFAEFGKRIENNAEIIEEQTAALERAARRADRLQAIYLRTTLRGREDLAGLTPEDFGGFREDLESRIAASETRIGAANALLAGQNNLRAESVKLLRDAADEEERILTALRETLVLFGMIEPELQAANEELQRLRNLENSTQQAADDFLSRQQSVADRLRRLIEGPDQFDILHQQIQNLENLAQGMGQAFGTAFSRAILGAESLGETIKNLGRTIIEQLVTNLVAAPIAQGLSALFGQALGSAFGPLLSGTQITFAPGNQTPPPLPPRRQHGGIHLGGLVRVGEKGPEVVNFTQPGRVISADVLSRSMGRSGGVHIEFAPVINSTDGPGVRRALREALPEFQGVIESNIMANAGRPSALRDRIRS